ncbi:hypothetical protein BGZ83_001427 [Gryganskiella cystojenkinii]|nr:hypothetical protein BGZ83_001427 [Gryganskiella cystojenkinii]
MESVVPETNPANNNVSSLDAVSVAKDAYLEQGWTPLMRNQEATNQICVNCEINPPIDNDEQPISSPSSTTPSSPENNSSSTEQQLPENKDPQELDCNSNIIPATDFLMTMPAPTSALPSVPVPSPAALSRSISPPNPRSSVLDPAMEITIINSRKSGPRSPSGRSIGISAPLPPMSPPPRSTTPLPMPPKTPPPSSNRSISGPLRTGHTTISRPAGPPPPLPAGPPPPPPPHASVSSPLPPPINPPQIMPRDKRRSPQSSVITQVSDSPSPSSTPPLSQLQPTERTLAQIRAEVQANTGVVTGQYSLSEGSDAEPTLFDSTAVQSSSNGSSSGSSAHSSMMMIEETSEQQHQEDQDLDLGVGEGPEESHDEFEDAEEAFYRPLSEVQKKRNSQREQQNERASRLMGEKMLQGWAMLQDPCPNPSCNGVPLMRNREKKEFCVVCEKYYQREMDLEHGKYTIVSSASADSAAATGVTSTTAMNTTATMDSRRPSRTGASASRPTSQASSTSRSSHYRATTSPLASPNPTRPSRDLSGRISSSIVLPPPQTSNASFGMTSQQIWNRQMSGDMDKLASEDEETRRHLHMISKVNEFSSRSLPPVPPIPAAHAPSGPSRPTSTYSNSSGYVPLDKERYHRPLLNHKESNASLSGATTTATTGTQPPPVPLALEVEALIEATHRTITTLLTKVEVYRLALEVSDNQKECQLLTNQIKGLMECLRACRECL